MNRPMRPRQHQLESESIAAWQKLLPSRWVFRPHSPDYGTDGEIEFFDTSNQATGRKALVQLRATDKAEARQAKGISLTHKQANYFRSLSHPVILVLYFARTNRTYVRWFHSYDRYYAKPDARRVVIQMSDTDLWTEDTPARIEEDVVALWRDHSTRLRPRLRRNTHDTYWHSTLGNGVPQVTDPVDLGAQRRKPGFVFSSVRNWPAYLTVEASLRSAGESKPSECARAGT